MVTASQSWIDISIVLETNRTEVNITELKPYTMYHTRVNAETIIPGPYSVGQTFTTLEAGNT